MITNRPPIPAIYYDNGHINLSEILQLTGISPQSWRYGVTTGKYPAPAIRGSDGDLWKAVEIRNLLTRLKQTTYL